MRRPLSVEHPLSMAVRSSVTCLLSSDIQCAVWNIYFSEPPKGKSPAGALSTAEREELVRLREENRQSRMERDFLKKLRWQSSPESLSAVVPEASVPSLERLRSYLPA